MSETEKKTRRERGLNIRVVQEQKEKKPDDVRVNTRVKKASSRKKTDKKTTSKSTKAKETKKVKETKAVKETKQVAKKEVKKAEKVKEEKQSIKESAEFKDLAWKKEEPKKQEEVEKKEQPAEKPVEKKVEKPVEKPAEKPADYFETLMLHTNSSKTESKVIVRDVAKEKPLTFTRSTREAKTVQPKAPSKKLPEQPSVIVRPTRAPARPVEKLFAKEIKEREIKKAVSMATKLPETTKKQNRRSRLTGNFGVARAVLAVACLSTAVFAIVYFVNLNSSDISLKVAAMQSGIEAVYPSYTPRGYTLADVTSASGKITMKFKSSENGGYTITEEQTDWNSAGVLGNFVKPTFGDEYTVIEEQGLTLYVGDRWAAWVNGGMLYKLTVDSGSLTKKQIKTIAVSL